MQVFGIGAFRPRRAASLKASSCSTFGSFRRLTALLRKCAVSLPSHYRCFCALRVRTQHVFARLMRVTAVDRRADRTAFYHTLLRTHRLSQGATGLNQELSGVGHTDTEVVAQQRAFDTSD